MYILILLLSGDPLRSEVIIIMWGFYRTYVKKAMGSLHTKLERKQSAIDTVSKIAKFQHCHPLLLYFDVGSQDRKKSHVDGFRVPLVCIQLRR